MSRGRTPRRDPAAAARAPRSLSLRGRLTLGFSAALAVSAVLMVGVIYVGIRWLPTYDLTTTVTAPPDGHSTPALQLPGYPSADPRAPVRGENMEGARSAIRTKEDVWNTVLAVSAGGVLVVAAAGLLAGRRLAGRLLAPLKDLDRAATKAAEGDLSHRINATGPHDELRRLADTFDVTLARLEESLASHRRFAGNAAHELLTPLSTTRTALDLLGDHPDPEELAEVLPMLTEANERNIRVVRELLRLASAEHLTFDPEPVDLAAVAEAATAPLRRRAPGAPRAPEGPELTLVADDPDCLVRGNAALLDRLVVNLVDNAVKHNVDGPGGRVSVTVTTDAEGPEALPGGSVCLAVSNTGPVVDPAVVDRLFEPFYRARPRVDSARGHGLGLALVHTVTRAHGGTVHAEARPAGGLDIRVHLPTAPPPDPPA
ncbi:ATP-binding protein (plasmid) [Streptomyces sp. BI20]|uniref:HAMP domain-containing sensor histidine kinase n=1 Tax=Streptomyces sp. BI20 TaxID=3403460 RepID=UPI003C78C249